MSYTFIGLSCLFYQLIFSINYGFVSIDTTLFFTIVT